MTVIPTPEAVEAMTDIPPDRLDEIMDEFAGYIPDLKLGRVFGTPTVGEFHALLSMAARALPLPRRYTGGPLEDGLYLWRPALWGAGLRDWASIDTSTLTGRYDFKEIVDAEAEVWLIGPLPIPPIPESEEASS